ncbi:E3 ubiquitin-protein ligase RBBP6-like [Notothenia coriiceps]|uniref:E3 ubiquitin-protein ligase RBBP6-like n=1 Tax=Notothenia coriiceps TaxID=8208 RepID=A0A6I9MS90_9TELE|nr:PREDICTED: E3 ubiquitin-protein ligase RBBP6-like [Notothenia coriiceps]
MKTVLKTLEELSQDIAVNQEDELVLTQVPHSKWEKEDSEEYQLGQGAIKVQNDAPAIYLPSPSVSVTAETSEEIDRGTEKDQTPILWSSQRSVAPSSGKDRTDRDEEKRMGRRRDRESDKSRDRKKERKISKERRREGEKERDRERERSHKSNPPSSSYSTSHDMERRDKLSKRAPELPDQNVHKTFIDTLLDSSFKEHPDFYNNHPEKGGRELEEMERPSSNSTSSSASQENGRDDARREKKKQKKHKKEKREANLELCEEEELRKQKKKSSKQSRDGEEEEISGDVDETMLMLSFLS